VGARVDTPVWEFDEEKAEEALDKVVQASETALSSKRNVVLALHDLIMAVCGPVNIEKMNRKAGDAYVPVELSTNAQNFMTVRGTQKIHGNSLSRLGGWVESYMFKPVVDQGDMSEDKLEEAVAKASSDSLYHENFMYGSLLLA
jgi:hypothetical protein